MNDGVSPTNDMVVSLDLLDLLVFQQFLWLVRFKKRQGIFRVQKLLVASFELGSWRVVIKFTATETLKIELM